MTALAIILVLLSAFVFYALLKGGLSNVARGRKYKSGTGWCIWRWTDVESEYILRLHVVKTPWFAVCLHWINKPDAEPWLHDHPVTFLSLILRGGYAELRATGDGDIGHQVHRWFNFVRASSADRHRIIFCRKNTLTLCFMGPKTREWGFHMPEGWVFWKDYYARLKAGENVRITDWWNKQPEPRARAFERVLKTEYTPERVGQLIGVVDGDVHEIERLIDVRPADEPEPSDPSQMELDDAAEAAQFPPVVEAPPPVAPLRSIYVIGSMRNPRVQEVAKLLREAGFEVFDDWISPGPEADDKWQEYERARGRTYKEALAGYHARHVYELDKLHLDRCDAAVLVLPAGKSAHMELGYLRGRDKPVYVLMDGEPEKYDIMYLLASGVCMSDEELLEALK